MFFAFFRLIMQTPEVPFLNLIKTNWKNRLAHPLWSLTHETVPKHRIKACVLVISAAFLPPLRSPLIPVQQRPIRHPPGFTYTWAPIQKVNKQIRLIDELFHFDPLNVTWLEFSFLIGQKVLNNVLRHLTGLYLVITCYIPVLSFSAFSR